jgi:hypothetical protein
VSVVRPEFGPTLPELVAPRWRAWGGRTRVAVALAAAIVVLAVAGGLAALRDSDGRTNLVVREPTAFNLLKPASLQRVTPADGEVLRLQSPAGAPAPQRFAVRPMDLIPYRGDVTTALMMLATHMTEFMRANVPGFVLRGEGRSSVNRAPGYQILYQARIGGRTTYGRRVLLVPDTEDGPPPRAGVVLDLRAARSDAVPNVEATGRNGALKLPLSSFRFGTERP